MKKCLNLKEWMVEELKNLDEPEKVNVINSWADKNHYEQIFVFDEDFVSSYFASQTIAEAYPKLIEWASCEPDGKWCQFDGYDRLCVVDGKIDEMLEDVISECDGDFSFQDEVDPDNWDYESYFHDMMDYYYFDDIDEIRDKQWCKFVEYKANDPSVLQDFIDDNGADLPQDKEEFIKEYIEYVYDRFEGGLGDFKVHVTFDLHMDFYVNRKSAGEDDALNEAVTDAHAQIFRVLDDHIKFSIDKDEQD